MSERRVEAALMWIGALALCAGVARAVLSADSTGGCRLHVVYRPFAQPPENPLGASHCDWAAGACDGATCRLVRVSSTSTLWTCGCASGGATTDLSPACDAVLGVLPGQDPNTNPGAIIGTSCRAAPASACPADEACAIADHEVDDTTVDPTVPPVVSGGERRWYCRRQGTGGE